MTVRRIQKYVAMFMVAILCLCNVQTTLAEEADWDPESGKKYPVITTTKLENAIVGETKSVVLNATPMYGGEITWSIVEIPNDVEASIDGNILRYKPLENEYNGFRWLTVKATEEGGTSCIKSFDFCAPPDENSVILPPAVLMVDNENVVRTTFYIDDKTGAELRPGQAVPKNKKVHVILGIASHNQKATKINWESIGGYEKIVSVKYPSFSENRYFLNKVVTLNDSELIFDAEGYNSTNTYMQKVRVLDTNYNPIANVRLSFHQKGGDFEYNKVGKLTNVGRMWRNCSRCRLWGC